MSLITNERACHARLREIQRVTVVITEDALAKIGTNQGVGYAACKLPAACLPRWVTIRS